MKDSTPSLILFISASLLAILAKAIDNELLLLISKPMVVPAIFYYYLQTKTKNTSVLFLAALWFFFIGDMILVLFPVNSVLYVMCCGMISYLILTWFAVRDIGKPKFNPFNITFLTLLLFLLGYILFEILDMNIESISNNFIMYLIYGIVLIGLVAISTFNYISSTTTAFLHLSSMALCLLVSDLFYCINRFIMELPVIDHINLLSQFMSYFFMVKYFNSRKSDPLRSRKLKIGYNERDVENQV